MTPAPPSDRVVRECTPRVLAALLRRGADLDAAEDALQDAWLAATRQWPSDGIPDDPGGWLVRVASRRLVDGQRADRARAGREQLLEARTPADLRVAPPADRPATGDADDSVLLLLLCAHPVLPRAAQVALTLRAVAGLTTAQIARGFLVPETTMAQRISRAKATLRRTGARFGPPPAQELAGRVGAVEQVLYLVFTEAHSPTTGPGLYDVSLAQEAIRLTRLLHRSLPRDGEVCGLLALMLLTDARRGARRGAGGELVVLADQDRGLWDAGAIAEGVGLLEAVLPVGPVGPYQVQAAIAAVHAEAERTEDTDWAQIEVLYGMLHDLTPGPAVTLNHAVATAMVHGPAAGLRLLEPLLGDQRLRSFHRIHAVQGHLLAQQGRPDEARAAYATAARLATSLPEQRYLYALAVGNEG